MFNMSNDRFPIANWLNSQKSEDIVILCCLILTNFVMWGSL